jgi:hypothetical protein
VRSWMWIAALCAVGCGDVAYDGDSPGQQASSSGGECPPGSSSGESGTPDEVSQLLAEVLAPRICEQVSGSFIGLPGDDVHEGAAAGLDPSVGRWWIRNCQADVSEGRIRIAISGSGWSWIDRESSGFRVRQYLRFDAAATFAASLHVGYDARTRLATVWLRPAPGVQAQVQPQGLVRAEATEVFSSLLGGLLDLTGSSADDRARQQAADEGSQRLSQRLQTGFTVTYNIDSEQMDFMLGQLERGQTPQRPWPGTEVPWLVNARSAVWPAGMDVVGPIPANSGAASLDLELEEGEGAVVRRVCADELARWLDAAWNGGTRVSIPGSTVVELRTPRAPQTLQLAPMECRSVLVIVPRQQATLPAMVRYRVTPLAGGQGTAQVGALAYDGTGNVIPRAEVGIPNLPQVNQGPAVRFEVRSLSVAAQTAGGNSWDVVGGEPDPYVVIHSIPGRREIGRTVAADDARDVRFDHALPGALRASDFPLRVVVYDEDVTSDELIGTADVEASALRPTAIDLVLQLRSDGDRPVQTGTLRVRLAPVQ